LRTAAGVALSDAIKLANLQSPPKKNRPEARQQSDHAPNILTATNRRNTHLQAESWNTRSSKIVRRVLTGEKRRDSSEHRAPPRPAMLPPRPVPPPQRLIPNPAGTHDSSGNHLDGNGEERVFLSPFQEFTFDLIGSLLVGTPCWRGNRVCLHR